MAIIKYILKFGLITPQLLIVLEGRYQELER